MGNTLYKFEIQTNQINKLMIHIVDDLIGGPKRNKEEGIKCI